MGLKSQASQLFIVHQMPLCAWCASVQTALYSYGMPPAAALGAQPRPLHDLPNRLRGSFRILGNPGILMKVKCETAQWLCTSMDGN